MSWIIIVSTILALVSGGGVVYASENSLPGDVLYPIKTWVEDVRLAVASDQTDAELQFQFAERRLDELLALLDEDQIDDLDQSVLGYTNQVELLTQTMAKIQAQNPDEAVRLRMDLESKLQEQARRMEEAIGKADESDVYLQDRVRLMLQTNTQLRNRIQEEEETTEEDSLEATIESETLEENSDSGSSTQKQYQNKGITGKIDENLDAFKFNLGGTGSEGVYAMVAGARLSCSVKGDVAICPGNDAPERGEVELYDKQTNAFLFSFKYEHQFAHQRGNQDDTNGNEDKSGDGGSEHESGQNGTGN